jgi:hypothetical protein
MIIERLKKTLSIVLLCLLASCGDIATIPASSNNSPSTRIAAVPTVPSALRWLEGIPCSPPCWEGITPGQTTAKQAFEILKKSPLILNPKLGYEAVNWNWANNDALGGEVRFERSDLNQTIYWIRPSIKVKFSLESVIERYGEPSHIIAFKFEPSPVSKTAGYDIVVFYVKQGMQFFGTFADKNGFAKNLMLNKFEFFTPDDATVQKINNPLFKERAVIWQGFQDIDFYVKSSNN